MTENTVINNLLSYISLLKTPPQNPSQLYMMAIQAAVACGDFDKFNAALERLRGLKDKNFDTAAGESLKKFLLDIEPIVSDKDWFLSEYKQKNLLAKVNIFFQDCFENVSLAMDDKQLEEYYLEFIKTRLDLEYGYSFLALARHFISRSNYETVFNLTETVINRFPDSTYEFLALGDLLEIYKIEFDALERNSEDYSEIIEKMVQILFYIIKKHSYQAEAFSRVIKFSGMAFRYTNDKSAKSFLEKISGAFSESIYEEEIKLNFVNYYIGRNKLEDAINYLNEFEEVFPKTTKKTSIDLYKFECYIRKSDCSRAFETYRAIDEKSVNENNENAQKYYSLIYDFALLLEKSGQFKEAITSHEKVYKLSPVKKNREDSLYKLITLNINSYFDRRENIAEEAKNIVRGYCVSFTTKFPKSHRIDEIKLVYEGLNAQSSTQPAKTERTAAPEVKKIEKPREVAEVRIPVQQKNARPVAENITEKTARKNIDAVEEKKAPKPETKPEAAVKEGTKPQAVPRIEKAPAIQNIEKPPVRERAAAQPEKNREPDRKPDILPVDSIDKSLSEAVLSEEQKGTDFLKLFIYALIAAGYVYMFLLLPTSSLVIFYGKMILSFIPLVFISGFIFYGLFRKIGIFE